ncbi:MAG: YbaK/EbsC family protein [Bacilli bacterium]|nr:YbaK/EbsC family protein [Bacilli bacterium]
MALENVERHFEQFNIKDKIILLNESTATVELAAKALNTEEDRIAKSLSFLVNEEPIVIVVSGNSKISNSKFKQYFHEKAHMISFDDVENLVGHPVGGVCSFAVKENVKVYLDNSLKKHKTIFPACGTPASAIELTPEEMEKYSTNFTSWIDVTQ